MSTMIPQTRSVPGGCALLVHFSSTDLGEHCRKHKTPQRELGLSRDEVGGRVARFVVVMLFSRKQSKSVTIISGSWFSLLYVDFELKSAHSNFGVFTVVQV